MQGGRNGGVRLGCRVSKYLEGFGDGCESERCACECRADSDVGCHGVAHVHGENCGHEAIPHGDHVDYLVNGRLHHPHGDHCDDHGPVEVVH